MFDEEGDLNTLTEKFLKRLQKTIHKCFKKVRVSQKIDKEKDELFQKWRELKKKSDDGSKSELEKVEKELTGR